MRILVTGSTGFVGRHLIPELIKAGHNLAEITRNTKKSYDLYGDKTIKINSSINSIGFKKDIKSFHPEAVIHLASYISPEDDDESVHKLLDSNINFLCQVFNALKVCNIKLFINTGSFAEYFFGDDQLVPSYFYAATKTAARYFTKYFSNTYGFKELTVVPYTIYGGQDSQKKIIDLMLDSTKGNKNIDLTPGDQILDFVHIEDVVKFYSYLINNETTILSGKVFRLGTGQGTSLKQLAYEVQKITKIKPRINWGGKSYRKNDVMYAVSDNEAKQILNRMISLTEGLSKYINE